MLVEGLQAYLSADVTLQALLGTVVSRSDNTTGIFPVIAPDEVPMPYMVCQQVSGNPLQESMEGTGRLQTARWRFSCYGTTYKNAKQLAAALRISLEALFGPLTGSVQVEGAWLKLEADDAEPIPHGTIYTTHIDFEFEYLDLA